MKLLYSFEGKINQNIFAPNLLKARRMEELKKVYKTAVTQTFWLKFRTK